MADGKIEIIENTLLKLLIRRGINADRLNVVLNEGELGYTTDTKKLFIGDGSTLGGVLITGTKFLGESGDLTSLAPGDINDIGYNTITRQLCYISDNNGSLAGDWTPISNLVVSSDGTITIDSGSGVKLGDCAGDGLAKDVNNKLTIGDTIATNIITPKTTSYLTLPQNTAIGNINYTFPTNGSVNTYLRLNANGTLTWSAIGGTSNTFVNGEIISVGTILPYADTSLPANNRWLQCDGSYISTIQYSVLSSVIGTKFGPLSTNGGVEYFRLPDLRGKAIIGFTNTLTYDISGTGKTFAFAASGGEYEHTLQANEFNHWHGVGEFVDGTQDDGFFINRPWSTVTQYFARRIHGESNYSATNITGSIRGIGTTDIITSPSLSTVSPHTNIQPYLALNYIIKALADPVAECQITINDSLTASEAIQGQVFNINPLSGNYTIGLDSIIAPQSVGYLTVNSKGRVTEFDSTSAGNTATIGAYNTPVTHSFGFINFLRTPIRAASLTLFGGSVPAAWTHRINVYPSLSSNTFDVLAAPEVNIPTNAKNIIIQTRIESAGGSYTYSSLNLGLVGSGATRGDSEYVVHTTSNYSSSQVVVPLSANTNDNTISFVLRNYNAGVTKLDIEIIGWTL